MNYCIVGTEGYLINQKIKEVMKSSDIHENDLNVTFFDATANEFSIQSLVDDCNTLPFFGDKKIVVVRNPVFLSTTKSLGDKESAILQEYLQDPNPSCDLIFCGAITVDKRKKLVKFMQKECRFFQIDKLSPQEFISYVNSEVNRNNIELTSDAKQLLLDRLPNDLESLHRELEKLSLYNGKIDREMVSSLVTRPLDEDVFHLVNAVVQQDMKQALHLWRDLQVLNKDPIYLVALLSGQFRLLYQVKVFLEMGMDQRAIQSELKVHPFRVTKAIEALRGLSKERCLFLLNKLAECDQKFKMGLLDKTMGFELFLIEIAR